MIWDVQGMTARTLSFVEAIVEAVHQEMERDDTVFMIGQAENESPENSGLVKQFGQRIVGMPICEDTIVGSAVGASLAGMRPIVNLHNNGFMLRAMDQIVNEAAKMRYVTGGEELPLVIRSTIRTGFSRGGATHTQNLATLCLHIPGLQIVTPSSPYDAKGLMISAIRGDNPVLFFEFEGLSRDKETVPSKAYTIPFGQAKVRRSGGDLTLVSDMCMMGKSLSAAQALEKEGIEAEVIDLRTIVPLDAEAISRSLKKTGHLLLVEQGCKKGSIGSEIGAMVSEEHFGLLEAPIGRVAALDVPLPYSKTLEAAVLPDEDDIVTAARKVVLHGARKQKRRA